MKEEFKIATSMVGGYNKKDTDLYMMQLYKIIKEQQEEVDRLKQGQAITEKKLAEAKTSYEALWEKYQSQEDVVALEEELTKAKEMIEKQKELIKSQRKTKEGLPTSGQGRVRKKAENIVGRIGKNFKKGKF